MLTLVADFFGAGLMVSSALLLVYCGALWIAAAYGARPEPLLTDSNDWPTEQRWLH